MGHRNLEATDRLTPEEHWAWMADFAVLDRATGGPDAHMAVSGHIANKLYPELEDRIWYAGMYANVYNAPTAEAVVWHIPWGEAKGMTLAHLEEWCRANWPGLATRRERRAVRTPKKMAEFMHTFARWALTAPHQRFYAPGPDPAGAATPEERYELAWADSQKHVKFLGRYSGFKLLEFMQRYCGLPVALPDIRPRGGWSPRAMLAILEPAWKEHLLGGDRADTLREVNAIASAAYQRARGDVPDLTMFEFEVFLCDYKQAYFGRRQYPGRSQDSEVEYLRKIEPHWCHGAGFSGFRPHLLEARAEIFPHWALGEKSGWEHVRNELGGCLYDHGYLWSDAAYVYGDTLDLSDPVRKEAA